MCSRSKILAKWQTRGSTLPVQFCFNTLNNVHCANNWIWSPSPPVLPYSENVSKRNEDLFKHVEMRDNLLPYSQVPDQKCKPLRQRYGMRSDHVEFVPQSFDALYGLASMFTLSLHSKEGTASLGASRTFGVLSNSKIPIVALWNISLSSLTLNSF